MNEAKGARYFGLKVRPSEPQLRPWNPRRAAMISSRPLRSAAASLRAPSMASVPLLHKNTVASRPMPSARSFATSSRTGES